MKKLQVTIYILFGFLLLGLILNSIISVSALLLEKDILHLGHFNNSKVPVYLKIISTLKLITLVLFSIGVFYLIKILKLFTNEFYFSERLIHLFRLSGIYLILSGCLGFLLNLTPFIVRELRYMVYLSFDSKSLYIILIIIGLFFFVFSKVIQQGNFIKQENDLTI